MYDIRIFRKAREYLDKLSYEEKKFILNEIYKLKNNPYPTPQLKPLKGYKGFWKLYIKQNRAIIKILILKKQIFVLVIGHRRDIYKKFFKSKRL